MKVKDIMTKKVISVRPETPIHEVANLLFNGNLTGMPVINNNKQVVGIITEYDLMSQETGFHIPSYIKFLESFEFADKQDVKDEFKKILNTQVKDIMTKQVISVKPDTKIKELAALISDKRINPVPVVDKKEKLVGIVSRADVVKLFNASYTN